MIFLTQPSHEVMVKILVEHLTAPHPLQVEQDHPGVDTLHVTGVSNVGVRVLTPVLLQHPPIQRGHVLGKPKQLSRGKVVELSIEKVDAVEIGDVYISHYKLLKGEHKVIEWRDVEQILQQKSLS